MIPKIIHRTVPKKNTPFMDSCWKSVLRHTSGWEHMTHYDEDKYEYIGDYLDKCNKGAFRADLIRLEVLYRFGGIYLDSDVKLFKNLEPLLINKMFIPLENNNYVMNAIIGAEPGNKHIYNMIQMSIQLIEDGLLDKYNGIFNDDKEGREYAPFGPYVSHNCSFYVNEITKLSSDDFITFYGNRDMMKENQKRCINNNLSYGQHMYAGSWLNA